MLTIEATALLILVGFALGFAAGFAIRSYISRRRRRHARGGRSDLLFANSPFVRPSQSDPHSGSKINGDRSAPGKRHFTAAELR
jgi:hypothetical protein